MSIADFISNPVAYSRSHKVKFSDQGAATNPENSAMQVQSSTQNQGWRSIRYEQAPDAFTDFRFNGDTLQPDVINNIPGRHVRIGKANLHNVECHRGARDKGIRFLPWGENAVTCMLIDGAAKTFFTGPLSGCSIYIGEGTDGTLWAFHANRNAVEGQNNTATKQAMTALAIRDLPVAIRGRHSAIYRQQYQDSGFVFGEKSWGRWKFYVADTGFAPNNGPLRTVVTRLP
jgi:hypothetical protein